MPSANRETLTTRIVEALPIVAILDPELAPGQPGTSPPGSRAFARRRHACAGAGQGQDRHGAGLGLCA